MTVTKESRPALFKALEMISHDSGAQAGWTCYDTPECWDPVLAAISTALVGLDEEDFRTFCIGEKSDQEEIIYDPDRGSDALCMAQAFLNSFFEQEWARR